MTVVKKLKPFFLRLLIHFRRLIIRCPKWLKILRGPLLGGLIGIIGGVPGFFIGLLLGFLLGELITRIRRDKRIADYFKNPGRQQINEDERGMAAWCALAALILTEDSPESPVESVLKQVVPGGAYLFTDPHTDLSQMEYFVRIALSCKDNLNPDLLAESLSARRSPLGDAGNFGRSLYLLAEGERAKALARGICFILDPRRSYDMENDFPDQTAQKDPWKILGLKPGTPLNEVKAHYRRLAKQFHPDELQILDEKHREIAAQAFMAIREAYRQIAE